VTVEPCRETNLGFLPEVEPCRETNFGFLVTVEPSAKGIACVRGRSNRLPSSLRLQRALQLKFGCQTSIKSRGASHVASIFQGLSSSATRSNRLHNIDVLEGRSHPFLNVVASDVRSNRRRDGATSARRSDRLPRVAELVVDGLKLVVARVGE
jgi:hypothetical protein